MSISEIAVLVVAWIIFVWLARSILWSKRKDAPAVSREKDGTQ